jgi:hypothetical protein
MRQATQPTPAIEGAAAKEFERQLEIFRREAEGGAQFLYAYLAIHAVGGDSKAVFKTLRSAPLFWNTTLAALQLGAFITLGRIFDQDSAHNIGKLLRLAQDHPEIFTKAYKPKATDFRRLRAFVRRRRSIYEARYRDLRHKVFAHKEIADSAAVEDLFARTNIRELQMLFRFLSALYEALWQLFFNGRKPALRPGRYSIKRIRKRPTPTWKRRSVQETITHEVEDLLRRAAGEARPAAKAEYPGSELSRRRRSPEN